MVSSWAVADVHGWNKDQRALQLVSYLDETTMNVAQEMGDNDLYNYDVLVKLLSDRFDPALRVSAFRSRFHGRSCRHHEDAGTFAEVLSELCQVGYPQSPPELVDSALRRVPGRDYSRIKCFSCGQFGHMRTRCPQPDASLPFRPAGWQLQSDNRQPRDGDNQQGNSP